MCELTVLVLSVWSSCTCAQLSLLSCRLHMAKCALHDLSRCQGDTFRVIRMAGGIIYAGSHVVSSNISWMIVLYTTWMKASSIQLYRMNLRGSLLSSSSIEVAGSVFIGTFTKAQSTYVVKLWQLDGKPVFGSGLGCNNVGHVYLVCQRVYLIRKHSLH